MVITLNGPCAEFLEEFAQQQHVTTDEALHQLILPHARVYYHGKQRGVDEVGSGVMTALDKIEKLQ